jgi:hypothetical protein
MLVETSIWFDHEHKQLDRSETDIGQIRKSSLDYK